MPVLQKITPAFAARLKVARLQALQDAPTAFGSTYAEESQLFEMDWLQRAVALNQGGSVGYLMLDDGLPCGMARGYLDEMDPQRAHVASMWVAAAYRRIGLGMRLLLSVETWATECGARELLLTVTNTNNEAICFYTQNGFSMTGRMEPYPNDFRLFEYEMSKPLGRRGFNATV
jgi:ribosomal protein S18 acetylase RimI-like enzyme